MSLSKLVICMLYCSMFSQLVCIVTRFTTKASRFLCKVSNKGGNYSFWKGLNQKCKCNKTYNTKKHYWPIFLPWDRPMSHMIALAVWILYSIIYWSVNPFVKGSGFDHRSNKILGQTINYFCSTIAIDLQRKSLHIYIAF